MDPTIKSPADVSLDADLIRSAIGSITGANVHRVWKMILAYEESVLPHIGKHPGFDYNNECEVKLRQWVLKQRTSQVSRGPFE
jgi:hypothetical protein